MTVITFTGQFLSLSLSWFIVSPPQQIPACFPHTINQQSFIFTAYVVFFLHIPQKIWFCLLLLIDETKIQFRTSANVAWVEGEFPATHNNTYCCVPNL